MDIKNKFCLIFVILFMLMLTGCVPSVALSSQDRQNIHVIKIDKNIDVPNNMLFDGDGAQFGQSFGLVGAIISANVVDKDTKKIQLEEQGNNINFEDIVSSEMQKQLNNSKVFKVNNASYDAVMSIKVVRYGFMATSLGFSNKLAPIVDLDVRLMQGSKVVWSNSAQVRGLTDNLPSYTMSEILDNPNRLREMWSKAVELVVQKTLTSLVNVNKIS